MQTQRRVPLAGASGGTGAGAPAASTPPPARARAAVLVRAMGRGALPWPVWASLGGNVVLFFAKLGCLLATVGAVQVTLG